MSPAINKIITIKKFTRHILYARTQTARGLATYFAISLEEDSAVCLVA